MRLRELESILGLDVRLLRVLLRKIRLVVRANGLLHGGKGGFRMVHGLIVSMLRVRCDGIRDPGTTAGPHTSNLSILVVSRAGDDGRDVRLDSNVSQTTLETVRRL